MEGLRDARRKGAAFARFAERATVRTHTGGGLSGVGEDPDGGTGPDRGALPGGAFRDSIRSLAIRARLYIRSLV